MTHIELQNHILKNADKLAKCLSVNNLIPSLREARISDKSILDAVFLINHETAEKNPERLIVELKPDIAEHDIIGQISKYISDLKIHPFSHSGLKFIAIAKDFDDYITERLLKMECIPIKYFMIDGKIDFCRKRI